MDIVAANAHLTYPHTNGFLNDELVLAGYKPGLGATGIIRVDGRPSCTLGPRDGGPGPVWFDIALDADFMAWVWNGVLYGLRPGDQPQVIYKPDSEYTVQGLCSVTRRGDRVVVMRESADEYTCLDIDVATGDVRELFTRTWFANHVQHSPYDESWIGFSHEGNATQTPDRMWAWHPRSTTCVLNQTAISDTAGIPVAVGHERWAFHDLAAVVCAYGESEAGPRGIYMVHPDGRPPRLVSAGDRFWHCDISRDGHWAVVDTTGPVDAPGRGWDNAHGVSDVVLVEMSTGSQTPLARTFASRHPHHPHPVFTPDGSAVLFNHTDPDTGTVAVARIAITG